MWIDRVVDAPEALFKKMIGTRAQRWVTLRIFMFVGLFVVLAGFASASIVKTVQVWRDADQVSSWVKERGAVQQARFGRDPQVEIRLSDETVLVIDIPANAHVDTVLMVRVSPDRQNGQIVGLEPVGPWSYVLRSAGLLFAAVGAAVGFVVLVLVRRRSARSEPADEQNDVELPARWWMSSVVLCVLGFSLWSAGRIVGNGASAWIAGLSDSLASFATLILYLLLFVAGAGAGVIGGAWASRHHVVLPEKVRNANEAVHNLAASLPAPGTGDKEAEQDNSATEAENAKPVVYDQDCETD